MFFYLSKIQDVYDQKKNIFNERLATLIDSSNERSAFIDNALYNIILLEVKEAQMLSKNKQPLTSKHYRRIKRYDILTIGDVEKLVGVNSKGDSSIHYFVKNDELFDIIEAAHINSGHKRTRVMEAELRKKYCNITRQVIDLYLSLCEACQLKKNNLEED